MVTCQSANQLKTPAKVSWVFKMVSQFGSLGYTIMGKTADLTVVQKTIIDTLHKERKPQKFIAKEAGCSQSAVSKHVNRKLSGRKKCGRKRCTTNRKKRSLMRIVEQNRFKDLGELHKEWTEAGVKASRAPHTDVSRNLATVVIRGVLPGLRRRRTGLLPSGPKSSFQMRASFVFHLETKVTESGGRVEKLVAQVAWSPVLSFHSLWWFGVQCHLLVLVHCVFWKPTSLHPFTKKFLSTSCFLLLTSFLKMLISFSSRIWYLPTLPKAPKVGLMTMVLVCLTGQQTHQTWTPENLWGIVKRKMRNKRPKNADELKATVKETWVSIPPQQCHKQITSMPRWIEAVIKAKGAPTKYWVHKWKWTYFPEGQQLTKTGV